MFSHERSYARYTRNQAAAPTQTRVGWNACTMRHLKCFCNSPIIIRILRWYWLVYGVLIKLFTDRKDTHERSHHDDRLSLSCACNAASKVCALFLVCSLLDWRLLSYRHECKICKSYTKCLRNSYTTRILEVQYICWLDLNWWCNLHLINQYIYPSSISSHCAHRFFATHIHIWTNE